MGFVTSMSLGKEQTPHRTLRQGKSEGRGQVTEQRSREPGERKRRGRRAHTSLRDIGVLSSSGRCCSRARTMQLAMIVARIMYSNGVGEEELRNRATKARGMQPPRWLRT